MPTRLAIIGTGVTGTAVIIELARQLRVIADQGNLLPTIHLTTIEKYPMNGPGYPYNYRDTLSAHLINHAAISMAIKATDRHGNPVPASFTPDKWLSYDFINWLNLKRNWIIAHHPDMLKAALPGQDITRWRPRESDHYPRPLFGYYLEDRFNEAVDSLKKLGVHVQHFNCCSAVAMKPDRNSMAITVEDIYTHTQFHITADKLLLATGRWPRQPADTHNSTCYFNSPFPADKVLAAIYAGPTLKKPPRVIIEGTNLSGIDAALTLATGSFTRDSSGKLRYSPRKNNAHIIMISRRGYFPVVRSYPKHPPALVHFTAAAIEKLTRKSGYMTFDQFKDLLRKEIHEHLPPKPLSAYFLPNISAEKKLRQDFAKAKTEDVLYAICRQIDALGPAAYLNPTDREFFLHNYKSIYLQNVAPMAVINAEKLLALFDAGILEVVPLGHQPVHIKADGQSVHLTYGSGQIVHADYMVNASGDETDIEKNTDPLITSMLSAGHIVPEKVTYGLGHGTKTIRNDGIKIAPNYAVLHSRDGQELPSDSVYAIGLLAHGWHPEKNFATASIEAAITLVEQWIADMDTARHPRP